MSDELPWETWAEKRERWTGVRFTSLSMVEQIVELFRPIKSTVEVNSRVKLTMTVRERVERSDPSKETLYNTREIVINAGDFIKRDDTVWPAIIRYDVVPYEKLVETMEPERK